MSFIISSFFHFFFTIFSLFSLPHFCLFFTQRFLSFISLLLIYSSKRDIFFYLISESISSISLPLFIILLKSVYLFIYHFSVLSSRSHSFSPTFITYILSHACNNQSFLPLPSSFRYSLLPFHFLLRRLSPGSRLLPDLSPALLTRSAELPCSWGDRLPLHRPERGM